MSTDQRATGPGDAAERFDRAEARAAFIARATAGATHELRNFLAIVKESAGLIGDLVDVAGPDRAPDQDKLQWALERIRLQVRRGTELTDSLNRVMHGLDHPTEVVDLGDAITHTSLLAQRFARKHRCRLEAEDGPEELVVTVNALDLYRVLMTMMEWCVERLPDDGAVTVQPETREGRSAVRFITEPTGVVAELAEDERRALDTAVAGFPGTIAMEGPDTILLHFT